MARVAVCAVPDGFALFGANLGIACLNSSVLVHLGILYDKIPGDVSVRVFVKHVKTQVHRAALKLEIAFVRLYRQLVHTWHRVTLLNLAQPR